MWRSYKNLMLLGTDNEVRRVDLGLVNSSQASTMLEVVLKRLREDGDLEKSVSPNFLIRKWPGMTEWSTKAVRDAFYASPLFPRLLDGNTIKDTIARGVSQGLLAYVGKGEGGHYKPFHFEKDLTVEEIEITDDMFIVTAEEAKKHIEPPKLTTLILKPEQLRIPIGESHQFSIVGLDQHGRIMAIDDVKWSADGGTIKSDGQFIAEDKEARVTVIAKVDDLSATSKVIVAKKEAMTEQDLFPEEVTSKKLKWSGQVPVQKWMNFYTKVLAKFATGTDLKVTVSIDVTPDTNTADQKIDETKTALRELGLSDSINEN